MQFSTLFHTITATAILISGAVAAPAAEAAAVSPEIDLWQDSGFLGIKFTGSANPGDCKNLASNFNDIFSSGKAKPGFRCTIWVDKDCKGTGFSFNESPGASSFPSWINDKASSWKCVAA
ncbi:hypothetical protein GQ53DRAFT_743906 [Thozetella sp. PMI_491]|nr:hypothetical protein GQ53DRAFT_743906 [Thozetella sp. PMI_491]